MKKNWIEKAVIIGIVLLFVGTSVVPASTNTNQSKAKDKDYAATITEEPTYNIIGGCNMTFDFPGKNTSVKCVWWLVNDRNFTYPIVNGNVSVNYTIVFQTYSVGIYLIPRLTWLTSSMYYPIDIMRGWNWTTVIIVPFWKVYPGYKIFLNVKTTNPLPTPPPDQGKDYTTFWVWNDAEAFTIWPVHGYGEPARTNMWHYYWRLMDFYARFI